jgi:hypothetical protein
MNIDPSDQGNEACSFDLPYPISITFTLKKTFLDFNLIQNPFSAHSKLTNVLHKNNARSKKTSFG